MSTPVTAEDIEAVSDLDELSELFDQQEMEKAVRDARDVWWSEKWEDNGTQPAEELPGAAIPVDGTTYHVHPIDHGQDFYTLRPGKEFKQFLHDKVETYMADGAEVYTEQKVAKVLDLPDGFTEIDDHTWAEHEYPEIWPDSVLYRAAMTGKYLGGFILGVPYVIGKTAYEEMTLFGETMKEIRELEAEDDEEIDMERIRELARKQVDEDGSTSVGAARRDPERLVDLENHSVASYLPEPLEREYRWRSNPEEAVKLCERSKRMADYLVHTAEADEVHALIGGGHYNGVRHYLEEYREGNARKEVAFDTYNPGMDYRAAIGTAAGAGLTTALMAHENAPEPVLYTTALLATIAGAVSVLGYLQGDHVSTVTRQMQYDDVPEDHVRAEGYSK